MNEVFILDHKMNHYICVCRAGFVIFYDMVVGMDVTFRAIRLVAVLYSGGQEMGQLTPIPSVQCQPAGALAYPLSGNPGNYTLLAVKQAVPR